MTDIFEGSAITFFGQKKSETEIESVLQQAGVESKTVVKMIATGNAGSGKSLLSNVIANKELFEAKLDPQGVTTAVERALILPATGSAHPPILLYNIPGLIELDSERVARNKLAIMTAFREFAACRLCGIFVMRGGAGARVDPQDIAAFKALQGFCGLEAGQLSRFFCCISNNVPGIESDRQKLELEHKIGHEINRVMGTSGDPSSNLLMRIVETFSRRQNKPGSEEALMVREMLWGDLLAPLLLSAQPMLQIQEGATIELQEDKWKAEKEQISRQMEQDRKAWEEERAKNKKEFDTRMDQLLQQQDALREELHRAQQEALKNQNKTSWFDSLLRATGEIGSAYFKSRGSQSSPSTGSQSSPSTTMGMGQTSFPTAFAQARRAGLKEFDWNGRRYNTKMK